MLTNAQARDAIITLLAPATRDLYVYTGKAVTKTRTNAAGVDIHDGRIGTLALAPDGTAAPYALLTVHPRGDRHTRLTGGVSLAHISFTLTVAAGSPAGARWALDRIQRCFTRARLHPTGGLLEPYFETSDVIEDPDASPTRWYAHLRYVATTH